MKTEKPKSTSTRQSAGESFPRSSAGLGLVSRGRPLSTSARMIASGSGSHCRRRLPPQQFQVLPLCTFVSFVFNEVLMLEPRGTRKYTRVLARNADFIRALLRAHGQV